MTTDTYYSHGKLLLSAEYAVLEGALALALPLRSGQKMEVSPGKGSGLQWVAHHPDGQWFRARFDPQLTVAESTDIKLASQLGTILGKAFQLSSTPRGILSNLQITTTLEFDPAWGWGSSSTLIQNLAAWLRIDPYKLLSLTFGGSGYDVACASASGPLFYQLRETGTPEISDAPFSPVFIDQLWVIYLNKKQSSQKAISAYLQKSPSSKSQIESLSQISREMAQTTSASTFGELMEHHEALVEELTGLQNVRDALFPDFRGKLKSLGAWGGDFILALSPQKEAGVRTYFQTKGFTTLFKLSEIILNKR